MAVAKKCTCNLGYMVVAWILFALGLMALVSGFTGQFTGTVAAATVFVLYFVGILLFFLGKVSKWKGHGSCPVHKMG